MENKNIDKLSLGNRTGLELTLYVRCLDCLETFNGKKAFINFKNHWFDKHFIKNEGYRYTYKRKIAEVKIGDL